MKKLTRILAAALAAIMLLAVPASAAAPTYTVVRGDTFWKIAVKYRVGCSEIIAANPQVTNPNLIYPGQELTIPETDDAVRA